MFKNAFKTQEQSNIFYCQEKNIKLQTELENNRVKFEEIRKNFDFYIPDYIVEAIIEGEKNKTFVNLHYLINCAIVNDRILVSDANLLKNIYKFN